MEIEKKIKDLGYELPPYRLSTAGNFVSAVRTGNLVYTAGHGAGLPEGGFLHLGKLGAELTIERLQILPLPNAVEPVLPHRFHREGQENAGHYDERFEAIAPPADSPFGIVRH